jgi:hypothetical protein
MHSVEYIPADWLERAAWAAHCGERMAVYSRPVQIERRWGERRASERPGMGRRTDDPTLPFQSLQLEDLAQV